MEEQKTISAEILKENGYLEYQQKMSEFGDRFFQKKFVDKKGVKYFINCEFRMFTMQMSQQLRFWDFSMQIDSEKGSVNIETVQWFNQDGVHTKRTIQDVEEYFEKMWIANGSPYYEEYRNEGGRNSSHL